MFNFKKKKKGKKDKLSGEEKAQIVDLIQRRYEDSRQSKEELVEQWKTNFSAYTGKEFKKNVGKHRSNMICNQIFSIVETVKPIMLTNQPKPIVFPMTREAMSKAMGVQEILDYEFKRSNFRHVNLLNLTNMLIYGTGILGLFWNEEKDNVEPVVISPFNFFLDPLATSIQDAEYCMYVTPKGLGELISMYPDKAEELKACAKNNVDGDLNYGRDAQGVKNQLVCIECYMKDTTIETYFEEELNEETNESETYEVKELKYKNGRRVLIAGDVLLDDGENPYDHGKFPFFAFQCYDVAGQFWGMSEVEQVIPIQKEINELYDDIIDNAHLNSNPVWILDDNCGIPPHALNNNKGLVLRKRPQSEVRREAPKPLPAFISSVCGDLKYDVQVVSGVFDATRGERPASVSSGVAIQALQDSSQGRIRLKTQKLEEMLSQVGSMWLQLIQQYWTLPRTVRVTNKEYFADVVSDELHGKTYNFAEVSKDDVDGDYDVVIEAGSTMPTNKSARIETLLRLAQTPAEDGMPMVGRREVLENCSEFIDNIDEVLARYESIAEQNTQKSKETDLLNHDMEMEKQRDKRLNDKEMAMLKHDMKIEEKIFDRETTREGKVMDKVIEATEQEAMMQEQALAEQEMEEKEKNTLQDNGKDVTLNQEEQKGNTPSYADMSIEEFLNYVSSLEEEQFNQLMQTDEQFKMLFMTLTEQIQGEQSEGNSQEVDLNVKK